MNDFSDVNILIVENDETSQSQLQEILEKIGYDITTCDTADKTIEYLAEQKVNIVIIDVKITDANDYDLLKKIKLKYPDVSVIVTTVHADVHSIKESLLNGANEYITKPFKKYEITMVLERAYWRVMSMK